MKRYILIITYKKIEVIRTVIGAINEKWARDYIENIAWGMMKGNPFDMKHWETSIAEMKNNVEEI